MREELMGDRPFARMYKKVLKLFITRRAVGILLTVVICVVSVFSMGMAGMELIPEMDQGSISVSVGMPSGSTMEETAVIQDRIVAIAEKTIPEMEQVYYSTGSSASVMSSASGSSVTISLVDLEDRDRSSTEVANQLRRDLADIAGCEITVSASSTSMGKVRISAFSFPARIMTSSRKWLTTWCRKSARCRTRSMSSPLPATRCRVWRSRSTARTHPALA